MCSSCGNLVLKQIDRPQCSSVSVRFVFGFGGAKRIPTCVLSSKRQFATYKQEEL